MNTHQLELNSQPLINTFKTVIGNIEQLAVNARELHEFLNVGKRFASWIQERISKYGFIENEDFIAISQNREIGHGRGKVDYHLTLDMAKELSMVENNSKGREARRYFIAMEKKALSANQHSPTSPPPSKEQLKILNNKIHLIGNNFACRESANQNIMNRLRVDLSLRQMSDFRQCHYDKAMMILDSIYNISEQYSNWIHEIERMSVPWIIRDGRPWTPELVKKLRGELDLTINNHPDWNKLAALVQ